MELPHLLRSLARRQSPSGGSATSPLAVSTVLRGVALGAAGQTRSEIESFIGPAPQIAEDATTKVSLGIFPSASHPLDEGYKKSVSSLGPRSATVSSTDYSDPVKARDQINGWCEKATDGIVKEPLPEGVLDHRTRLTLAAAVVFKGQWEEKFDIRSTEESYPFGENQESKVVMMRDDKEARVAKDVDLPGGLKCDACEVPFVGGAVFTAVKPTTPGKGPADISDATAALAAVRARFPSERRKSKIWIPRFQVKDDRDITEQVRERCPTVFGDKADLSGMTTGPNDWYLSAVTQGCLFKVDEEGAEAAAAAVAVIRSRSIQMLPTFIGDRPFAFFVHSPSGVPLFAGTFEG